MFDALGRMGALLALGLVLGGCGSSPSQQQALDIPAGCNPIASDGDCLLPFPSDVFSRDDATLPSGHRFVLSGASALKGDDGTAFDLAKSHPADGFSPGSQILALFPSGVDASGLVFHTDDVKRTLTADSSTQLIDAETGERVLHFAELDPRAKEDARRGLVIRPLIRLQDAHRYIVAIHGLNDLDGQPLAPPEGFRRIRDSQTNQDRALRALAPHYEKDIFPVLENAGLSRHELQLAWDFTTRSNENMTRDLLAVREQTMAWLAANSPSYSIVEVKDNASDHEFRHIEGTFQIPLFLEKNQPMAPLHYDANGNVAPNGMTDVPFTVIIPNSVGERAAGTPPARLMQYGHGFFGTRAELDDDPASLADAKGFVVVGTDWIGMSEPDRDAVADALVSDPSNTILFTDRLHQAMANQIALAALAQGALAKAPELQVPAGPAYDPSVIYYYGCSNGHILGGTYVALAPAIDRAVLGVGGADYSFMMFRAQPFALFLFAMQTLVSDALEQQEVGYLTQLMFDRIDPLTYAPHLVRDTYPGSPPERRVLMQIGIGDAQVNPLAAHLHARSVGIKHLEPAPRPIAGLDEVTMPYDGSAIGEFDFHVDPQPGIQAIPPINDNQVHEGVRALEAAREQISRFLKPGGLIEQTCDGVCDPE
jgi:hypothetical protein